MAARRKVISTYRPPEEQEPIELELNGTIFHFVPQIAGLELLEFVEQFDSLGDLENMDGLEMVSTAKTFTNIMFKTVVEGEQDKLLAYVKDAKNNIGVETLFEIAMFLMEAYTGRPTESSSGTSDGSATNGTGPTDVPSSGTGTTSVPPPPSSL